MRINMRDWDTTDPDRRDATIDFAEFMKKPENAKIRQKVCEDSDEAKRQFARIGKFYLQGDEIPPNDKDKNPIPKSVQFKVYDSLDKKRHDSVVIVLPSAKGGDSDEATDIWIAAWPPWGS
jgi:hypothetical protein